MNCDDVLESRLAVQMRATGIDTVGGDTAQETPVSSAAQEHWTDAWRHGVLLLHTLNKRGNAYFAQAVKDAPHVLRFAAEVVLDVRSITQSCASFRRLMSSFTSAAEPTLSLERKFRRVEPRPGLRDEK